MSSTPTPSTPSASEIKALAERATSAQDWRELLRDIRDLERWRELFFDLHVAKGSRLMIVGGLAGMIAGLVDPNIREQIRQRARMTLASSSEKAERRVELDTIARRLNGRGYVELHPDSVRGVVRKILGGHQDLQFLVPLHDQLERTDRFHQQPFGHELADQLESAERASDDATRRLRGAIEPLLADLRSPVAESLTTQLDLTPSNAKVRDSVFDQLVLQRPTLDALVAAIAIHVANRAADGPFDLPQPPPPQAPQFAPSRTVGSRSLIA